jgi:hypothetical protein
MTLKEAGMTCLAYVGNGGFFILFKVCNIFRLKTRAGRLC